MVEEPKPHTALLIISVEMQKHLKSGELSGIPVAGHTKKHIFGIEGNNEDECEEKLDQCIEDIKKWSREK